MLTALTPLGKVARGRRTWLWCVAGYTAGGLASACAAGALLGLAGQALGARLDGRTAVIVLAAAGALVAGRELARLPVPLPQARRATRDAWARRWGHRRAAVAWGLDIGSFFTTWMTFSGAWWVAALAVAAGSPARGAGIFAAYWGARAATVWAGPALVPDATVTPALMAAWRPLFRPFQLLHGVAVLAGVALVCAGAAWGGLTSPDREPAQTPARVASGGGLVGIVQREQADGRFATFLSRLDPVALAPHGPRAEVGEFHDAVAVSPDGRQAAVGTGGQGIGIVVLDLERIARVRGIRTGIAAEGLAWVAPRRLVALLQSNRLVVVDPRSGRVLRSRSLGAGARACTTTPTASAAAGAAGGLLVLLEERRGGAARLVHLDAAGRLRTLALPAGGEWACGRAGLAVAPGDGTRAVVVTPDAAAVVDLAAMTAQVHPLAGPRPRGATRLETSWLDPDRLVVAGGRAAGVSLVDTRSWTVTRIDSDAASAVAAGGLVLAYDGDHAVAKEPRGITAYRSDGTRAFRALDGTQVAAVAQAGGRVYGFAERETRTVELATGRVVGRATAPAARVRVTLLR